MNPDRETLTGKTAPIRRLRDVIPLEGAIYSDEAGLLRKMDMADRKRRPGKKSNRPQGEDNE